MKMSFGELLRRAKFASIRPVRHFVSSGDLAVFAHLLGLRSWLDRARIDLVIDVGGNIGQFASALRYIGYRGDILSFEPTPAAFTALALRMRNDKRWRGRQIAIGDHAGEAMLNVMAETEYSSFLSPVTLNRDASDTLHKRIRVEVRTLASIVDEMNLASRLPHTLLKSDTQGHEMAVLQGLGNYVEDIMLVQCEISSIRLYEGAPYMTEVINFLNEHHLKSVSFAPVNGDSVKPIEFDYLCVNEKY